MKKRKPNKYQKLINKFCENKASIWGDVKKIKIQMFLAKKMLEQNPDEEFWESFPIHKNCKDLNWFFTDEGKEEIRSFLLSKKTNLPEPPKHEMKSEKIGEDFKPEEKKPKTIREFLKDA